MFFVVSSNCVDKEELKNESYFPFILFNQIGWIQKKIPRFICPTLTFAQSLQIPKFQSSKLLFYPTVTNAQSYIIPKFQKSKVTIIPKVT